MVVDSRNMVLRLDFVLEHAQLAAPATGHVCAFETGLVTEWKSVASVEKQVQLLAFAPRFLLEYGCHDEGPSDCHHWQRVLDAIQEDGNRR